MIYYGYHEIEPHPVQVGNEAQAETSTMIIAVRRGTEHEGTSRQIFPQTHKEEQKI